MAGDISSPFHKVSTTMSKYTEDMQAIFHRYQREVNQNPAELHEVAAWAINEKLWQARPADISDHFSRDMAEALRQEFRLDEKGRSYRANHAVRAFENGRQMSFWADIDDAPRAHMEKAFAQRRRQIVGDSCQLRLDVDHYNDSHPEEPKVQLILDFSDDVEELMVAKGIGEEDQAA